MAMGLIAHREQHESPVLHSFDFSFSNPQFRRINEIIGRIHKHNVRSNLFKLRRRVIIPRGIQCVKQVVRVMRGDKALAEFVIRLIGRLPCRKFFCNCNADPEAI